MMTEYFELRCCMCPNTNNPDSPICPGDSPLHPNPEPCRFVKSYIDSRGWKYKVMQGIGESTFKARYQKAEKHGGTGWKCMASLPWHDTFDQAQTTLNLMAKKKGWQEWNQSR